MPLPAESQDAPSEAAPCPGSWTGWPEPKAAGGARALRAMRSTGQKHPPGSVETQPPTRLKGVLASRPNRDRCPASLGATHPGSHVTHTHQFKAATRKNKMNSRLETTDKRFLDRAQAFSADHTHLHMAGSLAMVPMLIRWRRAVLTSTTE